MRTFCLAMLLASSPTALLAGPSGLAPHRAVYDVVLDRASDRSGITQVDGRMVYEMTGSECSGYAVKFRFFQHVKTGQREYTSDHRSTSFEDAAGETFDFVSRSFFNGALDTEVKGSARSKGEGVWVKLAKPNKEVVLRKAKFATSHMADLLDAAKRGERIVPMDVFDGSDGGDEIVKTTAVIGERHDGTAEALPSWWPVSVSYFDAEAVEGADPLPIYSVSYAMQADGVSRRLRMQYSDYALKASLRDLTYLKREDCD